MQDPTQASSRSRTASSRRVVGIGLTAVTVVGLVLTQFRWTDSQGRSQRVLGGTSAPSSGGERGREEVSSLRSASSTRSPTPEGTTPTQVAAEARDDVGKTDSLTAAWTLVRRLEVLAQTPDQFHEPALPLLRALGDLCQATSDRNGASPSLRSQLVDRVIRDELRDPLVRGAVFLGLAPHLSPKAFRTLFDTWARDRWGSRELLRSAALAAAARGSDSSCTTRIDLGQLQELPTVGDVAIPKIYRLLLTSVVDRDSADVLFEVLLDPSSLVQRIEATQELPASGDAFAAADAIIAREVILLVLGHRSLVDAELQNYVVSNAGVDSLAGGFSVDLRAAQFLIHNLSTCSERYADVASRSADSAMPIVAGVSRMVRDASGGPLDLDELSRLHSLRWSPELSKQTDFMMELTTLGERLERGDGGDPRRAEFAGFLREIVNDVSEAEGVRMAAMNSLRLSREWTVAIDTASDALRLYSSKALKALAISALAEAATGDASQRTAVLKVLDAAQASTTEAWLIRELETQRNRIRR